MRKLITVLCISLISLRLFSQSTIEFVKEDLTFEIRNDSFIVQGVYYFYSAPEKEQTFTILYPFPDDSIYYAPTDISVYNLNEKSTVKYSHKDRRSIVFQARVKGESPFIISYKQKLKLFKAEYILLSTGSWGKSLSTANYKLVIPAGIKVKKFSINPDISTEIGDKTIFLWQRENFNPDKNLIFEYEKK